MGVAAGRGVSMWPPCKERQNQVSLGRASPSHSCLHWLWSHHIPGCSGQLWRWGLGKDTAGDSELVFGHEALELLGERKRGRRAGSRADLGRHPLERKVSPWSLSEVQERKKRRRHLQATPESPGQAKQLVRIEPKQTCKGTLQGA